MVRRLQPKSLHDTGEELFSSYQSSSLRHRSRVIGQLVGLLDEVLLPVGHVRVGMDCFDELL